MHHNASRAEACSCAPLDKNGTPPYSTALGCMNRPRQTDLQHMQLYCVHLQIASMASQIAYFDCTSGMNAAWLSGYVVIYS